jgi:hypothetical protein
MTGASHALLEGLAALPDPPCDTCRISHRCVEQLLCCQMFQQYVDHGTYRPSASRVPSRAAFRLVFAGSEGNAAREPTLTTTQHIKAA